MAHAGWRRHSKVRKLGSGCWNCLLVIFATLCHPSGFRLSPETPMALGRPHKRIKMPGCRVYGYGIAVLPLPSPSGFQLSLE